jgi:hypothetical protein
MEASHTQAARGHKGSCLTVRKSAPETDEDIQHQASQCLLKTESRTLEKGLGGRQRFKVGNGDGN